MMMCREVRGAEMMMMMKRGDRLLMGYDESGVGGRRRKIFVQPASDAGENNDDGYDNNDIHDDDHNVGDHLDHHDHHQDDGWDAMLMTEGRLVCNHLSCSASLCFPSTHTVTHTSPNTASRIHTYNAQNVLISLCIVCTICTILHIYKHTRVCFNCVFTFF